MRRTSSLAILTALFTLPIALADIPPYYSNSKYNSGDYGKYVTQTFKSNPQVTSVPILNFMRPFTNCDDGSYLFVSPRGNEADATPMILDVTGSVVWASEQKYGEVYNVQVQRYGAEDFLTFWAGNDAVGGHGEGEYYMLDHHYNERHRIRAANGLGGDLHAFTITSENTALITIYQQIIVDTSSVSGRQRRGFIWDAIFQEINIETGESTFEWRASQHIPIAQSYTTPGDEAWDVYHINSVERDDFGNYLISCRFLRAILYMDGKTGDVLWQLGGKASSFTDLSEGRATSFMGQHDAHWHEGHRYITFFDNRADWYNRMDDQSLGTRIAVDLEQMTARLDQTFADPFTKLLSTSQGSYQTLPNGHVVVGYGYNGAIAEFTSDGQLLCEAYMQPSSFFDSGDVQSYRNLRFNWSAFPTTAPSLVLDDKTLHMSWNGATEIETWLMLGSDTLEEHDDHAENARKSVQDVIVVPKAGFETEFQVLSDDGLRRYIRVLAVDRNGQPLGTSNVVDIGELATVVGNAHYDSQYVEGIYDEGHKGDFAYLEDDIEDVRLLIIFGTFAIVSALLIAGLALGSEKLGQMWSMSGISGKAGMIGKETPSRSNAWAQKIWRWAPWLGRRDKFTELAAQESLLAQDAKPMERMSTSRPTCSFAD